MKRPEPVKSISDMTPEEFATYDNQMQAHHKSVKAKIAELVATEEKAQQLLEEIFDEGTFGLTPQMFVEVLRLREEMNTQRELTKSRRLFLPAGTSFVGPRLLGFDVTIVDRPIALGPSDCKQYIQGR